MGRETTGLNKKFKHSRGFPRHEHICPTSSLGVAGWRRKRRGGRPRHISDRLDYLGKQAARRPVNQG